jgi:hypothetical protein
VAAVLDEFDSVLSFRLVETRPTTVGVELGFTLEKFLTATLARKGANAIFIEQLTGAWAFGAAFAKNVELERGELFTPLRLVFRNLIVHLGYLSGFVPLN